MIDRPTPARTATVLLLLAVAGAVDAIGVAETGGRFVSFMSGNTTLMGAAAAVGDRAGALLPLGLVALFVAGVTAGTLLAERTGRFAVAAVLVVAAALLALGWLGFGTARPMIGLLPLPVAMGLVNIVALRDGGVHPGVTYATGTLVRLGVGLAGLGRDADARAVATDLALWLALACGAVAGAAARVRWGDQTLAGLAAIVLATAVVHLALAARPRR